MESLHKVYLHGSRTKFYYSYTPKRYYEKGYMTELVFIGLFSFMIGLYLFALL